jgi:hypothetical protein
MSRAFCNVIIQRGKALRLLAWVRSKDFFPHCPSIPDAFREFADIGLKSLLILTKDCDGPPAEALDAAQDEGLEIHLWVKPTVGVKYPVVRTVPEDLAEEQYAQTGIKGFRACMNDSDNVEQGLGNIKTLIANVGDQIAGIHMDYMRNDNALLLRKWPCQCVACQEDRMRWLGRGVLTDTDLADPAIMYKELETRNRSTRIFMEGARAMTREAGLALSLAARANYLDQPDILEPPVYGLGPAVYEGQDWLAWAEAGLLDFICTMNYHTDPELFRRVATDHLRLLRSTSTQYFCGLGVSSSMGELSPEGIISHVAIAEELGVDGCCLFHISALTDERREALRGLTTQKG